MARILEFLAEPETEAGIYATPDHVEDLVPSGAKRSYNIDFLNLSETLTDTFHLSIENASWQSTLVTDTLTLGPCESDHTTLNLKIPGDLPSHYENKLNLVAASESQPGMIIQIPIEMRTPGQILLVDDDRWFDQSAVFQSALDKAKVTYDFWDIGFRPHARGSPPLDLLSAVQIVLWYTGYDWFEPITESESETLQAFLTQGGRLFLTSQDFLYYHHKEPWIRDYLGILDYAESVEPNIAYGNGPNGFSGPLAGQIPLDYGPYKNFSDGLIPAPETSVIQWNDRGYAATLMNSGDGWRSIFMAYPLETLPIESHHAALSQIIGLLGDLGDSTFEADPRASISSLGLDATRSFTILVKNFQSGTSNDVYLTNVLPEELQIDTTSITGEATYEPSTRILSWNGSLYENQSHEITYSASPIQGLPAGYQIDNAVRFEYDRHDIVITRTAPIWIDSPDLSESVLIAEPRLTRPNEPLTIRAIIQNSGTNTAVISSTLFLIGELAPMENVVHDGRGKVQIDDNHLVWKGTLQFQEKVMISLQTTADLRTTANWYPITLMIEDGVTQPVVKQVLLRVVPNQYYFPFAPYSSH